MSLSLCIAIFENLFDKSVGLSGRKTIMEAWNAQYAMCLAYFDSHCFWWENLWRFHKIFLSPPQVSRLAEWRLQCDTCHSHYWSLVRRSRNPPTRHLAAKSHVHTLREHGANQPACENLHISLHSHRRARYTWLLMPIPNSDHPRFCTCHNVTMSQCHIVTMSHIQKFLRRIQSIHRNFVSEKIRLGVSEEREEKAW